MPLGRKMQNLLIVFTITSAFVTSADAACYTVYKDEKVIYQSSIAPVDLSFPFSQTIPTKFGNGATMVFQEGSNFCPDVDGTGNTSISESRSSTPQLAAKYSNAAATNPPIQIPTIRNSDHSPSAFSSPNDSGSSGYGSRSAQGPIQTGPRGGQYYINSNGNKTYVGSSSSKGSRGR